MAATHAVRTTVTIPPDVKEQMDQVSASDQVNWSAIAAAAFMREVIRIRTRRVKSMTRTKIVERLQAAGLADPRGHEAGRAFGRKWAEEAALPRHLRSLPSAGDFKKVYRADEDPQSPWDAVDNLAHRIADLTDLADCRSFWTDAIGPDGAELMMVEDFARGFLVGAREVWEDVRDEVEPWTPPRSAAES
jgi:hypothetical protein